MKAQVYKLIELTGTSTKSIEEAVNTALKRAGKTIQNLSWFQIVDVFSNTIDREPALADVQWRSVHRAPPPLSRRSTTSEILKRSWVMGQKPSQFGYQPTIGTELSELEERIANTDTGVITSIQALYAPADDLTDPGSGACVLEDLRVRFETAPDLVSGNELSSNGQNVAWSITNYLSSLEKGVGELMKGKAKPETKVTPELEEAKPSTQNQ